MKPKNLLIFSASDFKYQQWSLAATSLYNLKCVSTKEGLLISKIHLLFLYPRVRKTVVFRYLNSRKSFTKSLIYLLSDIITIVLCKLLRVRIVWILHNIDKESIRHHKWMGEFRRKIVSKYSIKIFVIDKLLISYAEKYFPQYKHKFDYISFGMYKAGVIKRPTLEFVEKKDRQNQNYQLNSFDSLMELIKEQRKKYDYLGFCGGKYSKKRTNFKEIERLLEAASLYDIKLAMIVLSDLSEFQDQELFDFFKNSPEVIFVNNILELDETKFKGYIDFYWSGYSDISIPYTVYTSCSAEIPIVACNSGVLPELLDYYDIGLTFRDSKDIQTMVDSFNGQKLFGFKEFLEDHSWENSIKKILR